MLKNHHQLENAVLSIIRGEDSKEVSRKYEISEEVLLYNHKIYAEAGRKALNSKIESEWWYWRIPILTRNDAETILINHLISVISYLEEKKIGWWFLTKRDITPQIRFRVQIIPNSKEDIIYKVEHCLAGLEKGGVIDKWTNPQYEPEEVSFGGNLGMRLAHEFFCNDSGFIIQWLHLEQLENISEKRRLKFRKLASFLVLSNLLKYAGLDSFEQYDTFCKVVKHRPIPRFPHVFSNIIKLRADALQQVWNGDEIVISYLPQAFRKVFSEWQSSTADFGDKLSEANMQGLLTNGIRGILAFHIIFHWNRLGFNSRTQAILANLISAVLDPHYPISKQSREIEILEIPSGKHSK